MGRFIVIVLDGFGAGCMEDVPQVRPADMGAHTWKHIAQATPGLRLPNLEALGLMNIADFETDTMHKSPAATCNTTPAASVKDTLKRPFLYR